MKKGFGLIEVLFAAVVLGFLVVGLTRLQLGNREGILRIRARDVANIIAQDVIDSISTLGLAAKIGGPYKFSDTTEIGIYDIVYVVKEAEIEQKAKAETELIKAQTTDKLTLDHEFARQIDVTVSWNFKKSPQSISVSSVIR